MHRHHHPVSGSLVGLAAILLPTMVWSAPGDGLAGTAHDFSGQGLPATGLCSFCHAPHKAQTQELLWNHVLSNKTYSWDPVETGIGTPYPPIKGDTYTGTTAKCLSCHDGSIAIGELVSWNGGPAQVNPTRVSGSAVMATPEGQITTGHPVAMPYPFNGSGSFYNGVENGPRLQLATWVADPTALGIALYHDDGGVIRSGPQTGRSGIECSSCHDPHNGAAVQDGAFLRGTRGGICDKCHVK